jgi:hypothetical protein
VAFTCLLLVAQPARAEKPGAREPARVTVYPVSRVREGGWYLQRISIQGDFAPSIGASLEEALPDSLLNDHERHVMAWDMAGLLRWDVDFARGLDNGIDTRSCSSASWARTGRCATAACSRPSCR